MIWIVGANGMLGQEIKYQCQQANLPILCSDKSIDITHLNTLRAFSQNHPISFIINAAAYTQVDQAESNTEIAFQVNATGAHHLALISKEKNIPLIHISTDYVFDGQKGNYTESDTPNPINIYGKSKLQGEQLIQQTLSQHYIIRTAWLYGLHGNHFVKTMLTLFKTKPDINVVSDQYGSPTYTTDLATFILHLVTKKTSHFGIYHYTNMGKTSWHQFAQYILSQATKVGLISPPTTHIHPISSQDYPTPACRPLNTHLSKSHTQSTFHITIPTWQDAINRYLDRIKKDNQLHSITKEHAL